MTLKLPKLDSTMAVIQIDLFNPKTGKIETFYGIPSPDFQRFWQSSAIKSDGSGDSVLDKVTKLTTTIYPTHVASPTYDPTQIKSLMDAVTAISNALQN